MTTRSPATERVCAAALTQFAKHGYEATSLSHIAEDAGIRKASLYAHFASKDALFQAVFEDALLIEKDFVNQCFEQESPEAQPGSRYCDQLISHYEVSEHLNLLLRLGYLPPKHLNDWIDERHESYLALIAEHYARVLRRWAESRGSLSDADIDTFVLAYLGIVDSLHIKLIYTNGQQATARLHALQRLLTDALRQAGLR